MFIVSPITAIPVFLTLTAGRSASERRAVAIKTTLVSGLTLTVAYFLGEIILGILSIDVNAFRIAGSLVNGGIGWSMIQGHKVSMASNPAGAEVMPFGKTSA